MLAAGLLGAALSAAQAQPDPVHAFDWPRQPLHDALQRYSELTGDSVLYDAGHVADKTAPALSAATARATRCKSCWPAAACKPSTPPHAH